jgi:hypothetical protein
MSTVTDPLNGELFRCDQGDAVEWLSALPAASCDLVLCSPPYERARLYLESGVDLGIARDTEEWVAWMVQVCEAARRACRGLCAFVVEGQTRGYRYSCAPFLLVADLHRRGFHLRKPVVYRRVGIPGSGGKDWLRNDWEPVVCFARGGRLPWSDPTAGGHPPKYKPGGEPSHRLPNGKRVNRIGNHRRPGGDDKREYHYTHPDVANPGNVLDCEVGGGRIGSDLAHENEAPFPERLVEFFVRSFCPEGGLVIDPFVGSGTTPAVAVRWGRRALCCDLRQSQVELTRRRVAGEVDLFHGGGPAARPGPAAPPAPGAGPGLFDDVEGLPS